LNPTIAVVSVTDTASQVVSEPGNYRFQYQGPNPVFLGTSALTSAATPAAVLVLVSTSASVFEIEFEADAELYAVCQPGLTSSLKVVKWF
jgi:hypothetical protein